MISTEPATYLSTDVIKNGNENYIGIAIMIKDLSFSLQTAIPKDAQKVFFDFVKVDSAKPIEQRAKVMFERAKEYRRWLENDFLVCDFQ